MDERASKVRDIVAFNPPRRGIAGQTGTYQIVFKNGAVTTLEKVALRQSIGGANRSPFFVANFAGGGWQSVSFGATGSGTLDPEQIVAIVRLDEDFNDAREARPESAEGRGELTLSVVLADAEPALLTLRVDAGGASLTVADFEVEMLDLARSTAGVGLVFGALLGETESRASLALAAAGDALELCIVGAVVRYAIDAAAAESFTAWLERLELGRSDEQVAVFDEHSAELDAHLEALLEPIEATLAREIEATGKRRRGYSAGERERLRAIYFETVDYDEVVITGRHFFSAFIPRHSAMTLRNKIIYPIKAWRPDFSDTADMALLCHETCHVWQKRNLPRYNALRALLEHVRYGRRVYDYSIFEHERLTDFRFEQQGKILQDWWGIRGNIFVPADLRARYEAVIHASIDRS